MKEAMELVSKCLSLTLATTNEHGVPHCSYAPFVRLENDGFFIFVSALAEHTSNLKRHGRAGVLIVQDESSSQEIFARRRLSLDCAAEFVDRESPGWAAVLDQLRIRHGETVEILRELPDFSLVRLIPTAGTLVTGFANATTLTAENSPLLTLNSPPTPTTG